MSNDFSDLGATPAIKGQDFSDLGAVPETAEEKSKRIEAEKYDSPALAAAAAVARGASFGVSDVVARAAGLDDELSKLKEYNPKASLAGEIAGGVGTALLGPGALLAKGAAGTAKALGGGALARAAGAALEGAAYGGGVATSKLALQKEPYTAEDVAETIASDVGMGALTGGVLSLGLTGAGKVIGKGSEKIKSLISKATPEGEIPGPSETMFGKVVSSESPQAADVRNAAQSLGIDSDTLPVSLTNDSELVRRGESYLADNTTLAGQRTKAKFVKLQASLEDAVKDGVVDGQLERSVIQGPETVKTNLVNSFDEKVRPFEEGFQKFEELAGGTEIPLKSRKAVAKNILDLDEVKINPKSAAASTAREYAEALEGIENVGQLGKLRTQVGNEIRGIQEAFGATKDINKLNALRGIYDKMTTMRETWLENAISRSGVPAAEGAEIAVQTIDELRALNKGYAETKKFFRDVGEALGLGRVDSSHDLARKLDRVNDQELIRKLFNTKDKASLTFIKDNLPEVYTTLSNNFKSELYNRAVDKGSFSLKQFVKEMDKRGLSPEMQDLVLGSSQANTFRNVKKISDRIPDKLFKGSAEYLSYRGLFDIPAQVINNMSDEALYRAINLAPKLEKAIKNQDNVINGSFKNFFDKTVPLGKAAAGAAVIGIGDRHDEKIDSIAEIASNPELLAERIAENTAGLAHADDAVQSLVAEKAVRAVNFIASKAPMQPPPSEMFGEQTFRPSDAELAKFNLYVQAVDKPFSILEDLNHRVLMPESVEAVRVVYPVLFEKIKTAALDAASKNKKPLSYADKIQLSMLLSMPVSASLKPEFIAAMQQGNAPAGASDGELKMDKSVKPQDLKLAANTQSATQKLLS